MTERADLPRVGIVVPTHDRPKLLERALTSFREQDYEGPIEVVVVHDRCELDHSLEEDPRVRVIANSRTPGLAGARNSGISALDTDLVAFCDDDDWWRPFKLRRQVERWQVSGRPHLVTCSIEVDFDGTMSVRRAGTDVVQQHHLTRSRMSMLHSSTLLFDRAALLSDIGLVSEDVPGSQNEDWDLLLRSARVGPIQHVDEPLVVVQWGRTSFYSRAWESKAASLHWMLQQHPEIGADRRGAARVYGQIAFAEAAQDHDGEAWKWIRRTLRTDPRQWRAAAAGLVAATPVTPEQVFHLLHRFGRGV